MSRPILRQSEQYPQHEGGRHEGPGAGPHNENHVPQHAKPSRRPVRDFFDPMQHYPLRDEDMPELQHVAGYADEHAEKFPYEHLKPGEDPFANRPHFPKIHGDPHHLDQGQEIEPEYAIHSGQFKSGPWLLEASRHTAIDAEGEDPDKQKYSPPDPTLGQGPGGAPTQNGGPVAPGPAGAPGGGGGSGDSSSGSSGPAQVQHTTVPQTGSGLADATALAQSANGNPYDYGGAGNGQYDCSGFQSDVYNALTGKPEGHREFSTTSDFGALGFQPGFDPNSSYNIGVNPAPGMSGHMVGELNGVNLESGGAADKTQYGGQAAGPQDKQFSKQYHLPNNMIVQPKHAGRRVITAREQHEMRSPWWRFGADDDSDSDKKPQQVPVDTPSQGAGGAPTQNAGTPWNPSGADLSHAQMGAPGTDPNPLSWAGLPGGPALPGGSSSRGSGGSGGPAQPYSSSGGASQWDPQIDEALRRNNLPVSLEKQVEHQVQTESSGNPNAINRTDSNAVAGHPSQGLAQTIPSTFNSYHLPGDSSNITDPQANLDSAVGYAKATYGPSLMNNGKGMGSGHGY